MGIPAGFIDGCTDRRIVMPDVLTAAPTTRVPLLTTTALSLTMALLRTITALALITVALRTTVVPAFTLALAVGTEARSSSAA
jgi:hypothetical protein